VGLNSVNIDICEIVDLVSDERVEHVCEVGFNAGKMVVDGIYHDLNN